MTIIQGTSGNDTLTGGPGDDTISGLDGNDTLIPGTGVDLLDGGDGTDTVVISSNRNSTLIQISAAGDVVLSYTNGLDTLRNVETVTFSDGSVPISTLAQLGTSGADTLTATADGQALGGLGGDDVLSAGTFQAVYLNGGDGNDILISGPGANTLVGGAGADTFRGTAAALNGDTIFDLQPGDKINITDVSLNVLSAGLQGQTLFYTGGSLTIASAFRPLLATADPSGGVDLTALFHVAANDFNGDGKSDILWRSDSGQMSNWLGQTNGGFVANDANAFRTVSTNWHIVGSADFNGDGKADVLWRSDSGQLSNWLAQPNGSFTSNDANAFSTVSTDWKVAGTGDFNGDGRSDILWRNDNGQMSNWLAQSNGGFVSNDANAFASVATNWHIVGTGDFNNDGRSDILWRSDSGQLSDWLGQANGGFVSNDANALVNVPTNWHVVGTGDFNGDGRYDILWRSESGQLSDWLGQANGGFANNDANAFVNVPTNWHVVSVGDYNGDGRDDILWQNTAGQTSDWLGQANGGFVSNDPNAFTNVPPSWHPQGFNFLL